MKLHHYSVSQVASKPDLYPLVISYNGDSVVKTSNGSTGYLMVQYFRNFIVRPVGKCIHYVVSVELKFVKILSVTYVHMHTVF